MSPRKPRTSNCHPQEQKEVEEFLNDQLSKGYIREKQVTSDISGVSLFPKKDMRKQMVQDY